MPQEIEDVLADLLRGLEALERARPVNEEAKEFYEGTDEEVLISDELRRLLRGSANAFPLCLAAIPVNTVADRLFIASVTSPDDAVQEAIDQILELNDFYAWSNSAMRQAQMYGDMYVYVWPGEIEGTVTLAQMDPLTTRVIYDSEYERFPVFTIRAWEEPGPPDSAGKSTTIRYATISYPDEVYKFQRNDSAKKWEKRTVLDENEGEEPWPLQNKYLQLPYGHLRNALPYGTPGHAKAYGTQRLITKNRAAWAANIDWMALPQRYALMHEGTISGSPGNLPLTTADGAVTASDQRRPRPLTVRQGSILELHARGAGEFSPADPNGYIAIENSLKMDMASATSMPLRLFSDNSGQQPSGDSQRENDRPLRTMVRTTRGNLAAGWVSIFQSALAILGFSQAEVNIEWERDEVSTDRAALEAADLVVSLVERGLQTPVLRPIVEHKLMEMNHSADEIKVFFGDAVDTATKTGSGEPNPVDITQGAIPQ